MPNRKDAALTKQPTTTPVAALRPIENTVETIQQALVIANLQDEIRVRAYELYEQRGREDGQDVEDWIQAEAEILARNTQLAA
jgi:Protein of unknown function (DUF2934)